MRRIVHLVQVQTGISDDPMFAGAPVAEAPQHLNGYILNRSTSATQERVGSWKFRMLEIWMSGGSSSHTGANTPGCNGTHSKILQLRPVGCLVPLPALSSHQSDRQVIPSGGKDERNTPQSQPAHTITLRPVQSGESYRISSPPARGLVRSELAAALNTVFEQLAREHGFTRERPLEISLSRGFKANSHGHKEGRAADIAAVEGKSLLKWKQEWDQALVAAARLADPGQRSKAIAAEERRNLGYRLYKVLQAHGGWRVNPSGWRVYRNVMQLFGPWTGTEGPWKAMKIESPTPEERQRLADQDWVFRAHQDHIHVAR